MLFVVPVAGAQATITVANSNNAGIGSLRQAIFDAAPGETIVLPSGTYTLTSGELAIAKSVTISGHAAGDTIVRAGGASRVFHTSGASNTITISGITIRDGLVVSPSGFVEGGGVWNPDATLTLSDVILTNNQVDTDGALGGSGGISYGGAVANDSGTLTLSRSQVIGNTASALGGAGAGSTDGKPGGIVQGGALMNTGALTVTDTTFAANAANATGGQGGNSKNGGPGGIVFGGGAFIQPGSFPASVSSSTLNGNIEDTTGGPPGSGGTDGPGGISQGGGLFVSATSGVIALPNLTVTANVARTSDNGIAQGGGLYASGSGSGKTSLANATVASNVATGPLNASGGNLNQNSGVQVRNTIISAGVAGPGLENCSSAATSLGHNLEDTTPSQCGLVAALGDRVGASPLLGPLQANGATSQTMALLGASPAIDAADGSGCPATDERGLTRPQGAACDIGAYETAPGAAITGLATGITTTTANLGGQATNPDLVAGIASFEYGPSSAYGLVTGAQPVALASAATPFAASITGLTPGATYHFRAVERNAAGTVFGADQTFVAATTLPLQAPVLGTIKLSPHNVLPHTGRGASAARKGKRQRGTAISYTDSQRAVTTFTTMSRRSGFRSGSKCLAKRPLHQKGKQRRCIRYVRLGAFAHSDVAGANRFHFTGRLNRRPLRVGRYRLSVVARIGGRASHARVVDFRIVR